MCPGNYDLSLPQPGAEYHRDDHFILHFIKILNAKPCYNLGQSTEPSVRSSSSSEHSNEGINALIYVWRSFRDFSCLLWFHFSRKRRVKGASNKLSTDKHFTFTGTALWWHCFHGDPRCDTAFWLDSPWHPEAGIYFDQSTWICPSVNKGILSKWRLLCHLIEYPPSTDSMICLIWQVISNQNNSG